MTLIQTYMGDYPVEKKWAREHGGETWRFLYLMTLDDLIEAEGIEGMNDFLDSVLGNVTLQDISYVIAGATSAGVDIVATGEVAEF